MTINIKSIRAAAEAGVKALHAVNTPNPSEWVMSMHPATVLALCDEIERLRKDAERYRWLAQYFVSDRTDQDDAIVAASEVGVDQVTEVIDAAMESKT